MNRSSRSPRLLRSTPLFGAMLVFVAAASVVQAQAALHVGVGRATLTGGDFDGVESGWAFSGRYVRDMSGFQTGIGLAYTRVRVDDLENPISQYDALLHYRHDFNSAGVRPFVGAALGLAAQSFNGSVNGQFQSRFTAWGGTLGLEGGLIAPVSDRLAVEGGVTGRALWMGSFSSNGESIQGSSGSGLRIGALLGVVLLL